MSSLLDLSLDLDDVVEEKESLADGEKIRLIAGNLKGTLSRVLEQDGSFPNDGSISIAINANGGKGTGEARIPCSVSFLVMFNAYLSDVCDLERPNHELFTEASSLLRKAMNTYHKDGAAYHRKNTSFPLLAFADTFKIYTNFKALHDAELLADGRFHGGRIALKDCISFQTESFKGAKSIVIPTHLLEQLYTNLIFNFKTLAVRMPYELQNHKVYSKLEAKGISIDAYRNMFLEKNLPFVKFSDIDFAFICSTLEKNCSAGQLPVEAVKVADFLGVSHEDS